MCGIVGCVGFDNAGLFLLDGLKRLEYRGYDSAGISIISPDGTIDTVKSVGKIAALENALATQPLRGSAGIGHTRWATHGAPSTQNAHPHLSCDGRIAVVHNGIIENYQTLRDNLLRAGHSFVSQTDTEVIVHLIEEYYDGTDPLAALQTATAQLEGAYSLAVLFADHPHHIYATRKDSPLAICATPEGCLLASDAIPLVPYTDKVCYLADCEIAELAADGTYKCFAATGALVEPCLSCIEWDAEDIELDEFSEYMLKEIHEQPIRIQSLIASHVRDRAIYFSEDEIPSAFLADVQHITIVACGTSYHAGLFARELMEAWLGIRVDVEIASEYRYRTPVVDAHTLVLAISQSGETADTLAAVRLARSRGATVVGLTNVPGSRITRECDHIVFIQAGIEISVAATKSFTAQLTVLSLISLYMAQMRGALPEDENARLLSELAQVPEQMADILTDTSEVERVSKLLVDKHSIIYVGRGISNITCREGALKLKEISYIHAEAYAAGEIKHGPIALVDAETPVVALAVNGKTLPKTVSNIREVQARNALVVVVSTVGNDDISGIVDAVLWVPRIAEEFSCLTASVPLQLLAYHIAKGKGCNVDQPRNLAKSVTVE